ncbi:MAG: hypothetical protein JXP37_02850 [Coriobacteriia bacterium]|nr:hypothetical protein [Coriobacteriia bacterium]
MEALPVVALLCLAVALLPNAAVATEVGRGAAGSVQVTAVVRPEIRVAFGDGHLTVRSNIPWEASAHLPDGEQWTVNGGPTLGHRVEMPEGATGAQVYAW